MLENGAKYEGEWYLDTNFNDSDRLADQDVRDGRGI
jgi:hypothetical protein